MTYSKLIQILESLRQTNHYECEDCYYSCPMNEDYCGGEDRNHCECGLIEDNAKIDKALEIVKNLIHQ